VLGAAIVAVVPPLHHHALAVANGERVGRGVLVHQRQLNAGRDGTRHFVVEAEMVTVTCSPVASALLGALACAAAEGAVEDAGNGAAVGVAGEGVGLAAGVPSPLSLQAVVKTATTASDRPTSCAMTVRG